MLLFLRIILNWHRPDKYHASLSILRQFAQSCFRRIVWQNPCQFARIVRKISCQMAGKISCHIAVQQMVQCSKNSVHGLFHCDKNIVHVLFPFCSIRHCRFVPVLFPFCFPARLLRNIVAQDCCVKGMFHAILLRVQPVSRNIVAHCGMICRYPRRKTM